MLRSALALASVCSLVLLAATSESCTSDNPVHAGDAGTHDAGCQAYTSTADLATPAVSFSKDVLPVFQQSCGIAGSTCHGDPSVTKQSPPRPFLGLFDGGTDAGAVEQGIVGVKSAENPSMNMVTAKDPANSFLMHKMDGDQCTLAAQCAKGTSGFDDCGQSMPQSSPVLDDGPRDTVRRWIAQGAASN